MKIEEILEMEKNNKNRINIVKEGFFYRCYEYSAMRFIRYIKKFQVLKKYYKKLNKILCYIGFPISMDNLFLSFVKNNSCEFSVVRRNGGLIVIEKKTDFCDEDDFNRFLAELSNINPLIPNDYKEVIAKIKKFNVTTKTPLESVQFILELQQMIDLIENGNNYYGKI